ncbi:hypothetical protein CPB83DRAFT_856305 [Crepidotus variabilis]|uniref:Uncharacterized protein n=1 Tax=Crepidotus variabilis TaxID=179855 RepID=A0A9P6EDZ9_9AGAR|nr:hypothetical protein CPB83DRAFT_856305 [Crepidotus variabilis]
MGIDQPHPGDLPPAPPHLESLFTQMKAKNRDFLVRADYIRLYDYIEAEIQHDKEFPIPGRSTVIVVTGQPGIGKTTWVEYAIRHRLGEGK